MLLVEESYFVDSCLKQSLLNNGHNISHYTTKLNNLVDKIVLHKVQVLIMNINRLGQKELSEIAKVNQLSPLPILIFIKCLPSSMLQASLKATVATHVDENTDLNYISHMISLAWKNFKKCQLTRIAFEDTKTQLASRKLIESAKRLIMKQKNISEQSADAMLKKMSADNHQTLKQVAQNVISVCHLLNPKT
jgi:response regulator NasT